MLFTPEDQKQQNEAFEAKAVNNLGPVTCTGGQKALYIFFSIITLGIFLACQTIGKMNRLNRMQNKINESASGIDVQLQKRFDTLTKLVSAVEGHVKFNKEVYENIAKYRSGINDNVPEGTNPLAIKEAAINKIQTGLTMAFENYPNLGADDSIRKMMTEATMIEKEIAASRRLYNADVTAFNSEIYTFPTNVLVAKKGYRGLPLFQADEAKRADVNLKF